MTVHRTAEDVARWAAFVGHAEAAVRHPSRSTIELERACARAVKAVLPCEPFTADNPWVAVLRLAQRFATLPAVERIDAAGELETALAAAHDHCRILPTQAARTDGADAIAFGLQAARLPYAED